MNLVAGTLQAKHGNIRADAAWTGQLIARCVTAREGSRQDYETETLIAHALRADGFDASEDGTGRGTPLVPIAFHARQDPDSGPVTHPLDTDGASIAVAVNLRGRDGGAMPEVDDIASLRAASGGSSRSYVASAAVRRLTPRECERLQGFPDDWTLIPYRGKPAADGPRYKALGNSMAVPVMRWLGERIAMVESLRAAA